MLFLTLRRSLAITLSVSYLWLTGQANAVGAPSSVPILPRDQARSIAIADFAGQPYLQAMRTASIGIYDKTNRDDGLAVTISGADQLIETIKLFDERIGERLYRQFQNGPESVRAIVKKIEGQTLSPSQIRAALEPNLIDVKAPADHNLALSSLSAVTLLASGSGTIVILAPENYFYNVGYQTPITGSGRTFAVASSRRLLDPSDRDFLSELHTVLAGSILSTQEEFYRALFGLLTSCNPNVLRTLSAPTQTALVDFIAVYTAELDRHVMTGLQEKNPWEIDLAEVTLLDAYGAASGLVMSKGKLVAGDATAYFAHGPSGGGGIGETRADFTKLGSIITNFERAPNRHPELISRLEMLTPIATPAVLNELNGDVFRRVLVFLNTPASVETIKQNSDAINDTMVEFLSAVRADQAAITAFAKNQ